MRSAEQQAFGEMRPFVWELGLCAHEQDFALEAGVAQAGPHGVACRTAADDYCFRDSSRIRSKDQPRYPPRTAIATAYPAIR